MYCTQSLYWYPNYVNELQVTAANLQKFVFVVLLHVRLLTSQNIKLS